MTRVERLERELMEVRREKMELEIRMRRMERLVLEETEGMSVRLRRSNTTMNGKEEAKYESDI